MLETMTIGTLAYAAIFGVLFVAALAVRLAWNIGADGKDKKAPPPTDTNSKQLGAVMDQRVGFSRRKLMNRGEYGVYRALLNLIHRPEYQAAKMLLFTQVPGSAIIETSGPRDVSAQAYRAIRYKVFDFVIINGMGFPLAIVEYNGQGHYQSNSGHRDQIKNAACERAGIAFIQVEAEEKQSDYLPRIAAALSAPAANRVEAAQ